MKKKYLLLFIPLLLISCSKNTTSSSTSSSSNQESNLSSSISTNKTNVEDFEYIENEDGTLTITNYKNYKPKEVIIPEYINNKLVAKIAKASFSKASGILGVFIPKSIISIDEEAFSECASLKYFKVDDNNLNFTSEAGILYSKDFTHLITCPRDKNDTYSINDNTLYIDNYAFFQSRLKSLTFNNKILSFGKASFSYSRIPVIEMPNSVISIGEECFLYATINTLTLSTSLTNIPFNSISFIENLTSLVIPGSIETIKENSITGNPKLKNLILSEGIKRIEKAGLSYNSLLENIVFPKSLKYIGEHAFISTLALKKIELNEGLEEIGDEAFIYSRHVTSITIPKSVKKIGKGAFSFIEYISSITVDDNNPYFISENNALYSKDKTRLLAYASYSLTSSFIVDEETITIDRYAFTLANRLTSFTLNKKIKTLERELFSGVTSLKKIIYLSTEQDYLLINIKEEINDETIYFYSSSSISSITCLDKVITII